MQLPFDARQVQPTQAFEALPTDWYVLQIAASEMIPTKDGKGAYLNLEMSVLDGPYKGRKVFDRLNLHNANPVAQEIAYKTLSAICHATGQLVIQDSQQLHGKPLEARITVRAPEGNYDASNDVKGYRAVNSGKTPAGNGQGAATPYAHAPAGGPAPFAAPAPSAAPSFAPPPPAAAAPAAWAPPAQPQAAPPQAAAWAPPAAPAPVAAAPAFQPPQYAPPQNGAAGAPQFQPPQAAAAPAAGAVPPWMQPRQ